MRISDWSSDVCSSDLAVSEARPGSFVDEAALEFANGHGGFAEDGREYVTVIRDGALPPMPWLNVVANPDFGFTTTEAGGGYAWSQNSQRNPITPRSEEHTSELQSLMRISYAVFCLKKKK